MLGGGNALKAVTRVKRAAAGHDLGRIVTKRQRMAAEAYQNYLRVLSETATLADEAMVPLEDLRKAAIEPGASDEQEAQHAA